MFYGHVHVITPYKFVRVLFHFRVYSRFNCFVKWAW